MSFSTEQVAARLVNVACRGLRVMMLRFANGVGDIATTELKGDVIDQKQDVLRIEAKLNLVTHTLTNIASASAEDPYLLEVIEKLTQITNKVSELKEISPETYKRRFNEVESEANKCSDHLQDLYVDSQSKLASIEPHVESGPLTNVSPSPQQLFKDAEGTDDFVILHLTDLHLGARNTDNLWNKIQEKFFEDLDHLERRFRLNWDAVLFTGDVAFSGEENQYKKFDKFLVRLYKRWDKQGLKPKFLAVPGNHDLKQFDFNELDSEFLQLQQFHTNHKVREEFFKEDSSLRKYANSAFADYEEWWAKSAYRPDNIVDGIVSGDFSVVLEKEEKRIGIVGLNSTYLNLWKKESHDKFNPQGNLAVDLEQLSKACGGNAPAWQKENDLNILMTHHPPSWIHEQCKFEKNISDPTCFSLHYCGHQHQPFSELGSQNASQDTRMFLGRSLYGREWIEDKESAEAMEVRIHGYSVFAINLSSSPEFRYWPRVVNPHQYDKIIPDHLGFDLCRNANDEGTAPRPLKYTGA